MEQKQRRKIGHIVQRGASWYVPTYLGRRLVRDPTTGAERWKEQRRWMRYGSYREAREALSSLRGSVAKATKRERRVLDEEQTRLFLAAARRRFQPCDHDSERNYTLFLTAVLCGLRSAELAGLRRQDVRLALGELEVAQTFYRVPPKQQ